ncbi:glycosyltransferase family 52 [Pectobacterium sp. CHL-2024]|uniref:glycosyltransferase family 52 n=1 Tax=Pectobacterium sp. CHL-2024 TaxID=3377079 RepID=UPI00382587A9
MLIRKKNKLFIVHSPLHIIICMRILDQENIDIKDCMFFAYYSLTNEKKIKFYLKKFGLYEKTIFYKYNTFSIINVFQSIYRGFKIRNVEAIYFSAIESVFLHSILAYVKHDNFFTFDDGTANIDSLSRYFGTYKKRKIARFFRYIFRIKHDIESVRKKTHAHYSIYKGYENITDNIKYISLFDENENSQEYKSDDECFVLLGSVFNEVVKKINDKKILIDRMDFFLKKTVGDKKNDFYYIPHPREKNYTTFDGKIITSSEVAEDIIINLSKKYKKINLYGFSSSAQFNVSSIHNVKLFVFHSPLMTNVLNSLAHKIRSSNAELIEL